MTQAKDIRWNGNDWREQREKTDALAKASMIAGMTKMPATKQENLPDRVTIREISGMVRMDVSACRRYVLKLGYKPVRQRTASSGYQKALTFSANEAKEIILKRHAEGYC